MPELDSQPSACLSATLSSPHSGAGQDEEKKKPAGLLTGLPELGTPRRREILGQDADKES